jgi:hypothetical protein
MPLSEHEERILAEIERQLAAEDPRFVARARRKRPSMGSRTLRLRLAVLLAVVGVVTLLGLTFNIGFGIAGMTLLLGAILLAATALREPQQPSEAPSPAPSDDNG